MSTLTAPTPLKNKRKVFQDDFTPRSSHVDKKMIPGTPGYSSTTDPVDAGKDSFVHDEAQKENIAHQRTEDADVATPIKIKATPAVKSVSRHASDVGKPALSERGSSEDNHADASPQKSMSTTQFDGSASTTSMLSQPDFSASVLQHASSFTEDPKELDAPEADEPDAVPEQTPASPESATEGDESQVTATPRASRSPVPSRLRSPSPHKSDARPQSPTRTPRLLRDFPLPLTTPRNLVEAALQGRGQHPIQQLQMQHHAEQARLNSQQNTPVRTQETAPATEDLLSFQTPAPKSTRKLPADLDLMGEATLGAPASAVLQRFKTADGEEMLLDMTPRVYSPRSIPLYTLDDMEMLKREFGDAQRMLEEKIESLHGQLAASVSHANHHAALTTQADSLHMQYSKKHVRKVTALKQDWDRKMTERLARQRSEMEQEREELQRLLKERDEQLETLTQQLAQERLEKKEVIEMGEQILAMVGNTAPS
ncbi:hypothetical protein BCR37DRAFT_375486 [Protomyces lactucae-debilis]|uniref:Uncharacterized protein n=1 Tax=Protomyces lactucae-debilis TaxID=2754530 RepID=A0A1Y2FUD3_PROLT|nr:uncharacterized protein BCR37DRAFT_375486 [Protomyces lactucae-debilis]ORY87623.1 hypothetical protein BCR37DRAFT_375486 [Protomyces lactucae-debilis]